MKTKQQIAEEIFEQCKKDIPQVSHFKSGGVFRLFIEIIASFLEKLYQESDYLLANRFLQTASGDFLTLKSKELGIENRFPAQKTIGRVAFRRENAENTITIDINKIITTKTNSQGQVFRFKVIQNTLFRKNVKEVFVIVIAEEVGSTYNVPADTITEFVTNISGVDSISNSEPLDRLSEKPIPWILQPGRDIESDDELRIRCLSVWQGLSGANEGAYIAWVKSIPTIDEVKVISTSTVDGQIKESIGEVCIICTSKNKHRPSEGTIRNIERIIESKKPITTKFSVLSALNVFIPIKLTVSTSTNTLSREDVIIAMREYFSNLSIGQALEPSGLSACIFTLPNIVSVAIDSPSAKFPIAVFQIFRLNEDIVDLTIIHQSDTKE